MALELSEFAFGNLPFAIKLKSTSKMKLTFNQILISRSEIMLSRKNMTITCAEIINKRVAILVSKL